MKRNIIFVTILVAFFALSCSGPKKENKETIKFGSVLALTGDGASYGIQMKEGMELAIDELNSDSTSKFNYSLLIEDSKFSPKDAISSAKKLVEIDKVNLITGITGSKNALAVCPYANEKKIVILDALSSSTQLTKEGGKGYFRIMPSDVYAGTFLANWAIKDGYNSAAFIYVNDNWGTEIMETAANQFKNQGGIVSVNEGITSGISDFKNILIKIKEKEPDVIFLFTYAVEAGTIVQQAKDLGIQSIFMGSDNISSAEFSDSREKIVDGVRLAMPSEGDSELLSDFKAKFIKKYSKTPSINNIKSYDVIKLAAYVMNNSVHDYDSIVNFLHNIHNYKAVSGTINFDESGDIINPKYEKMIYENGTYIQLK